MVKNPYPILFVCLGNICRSPLAQGVFESLISERGCAKQFHVDSCGTGAWHVGELPHEDSQRVAREKGFSIADQRARQLSPEDGENFELIVCMDRSNERDAKKVVKPGARLVLLREFDPVPDEIDVPDPYFGGPDGFYTVYDIIERSCRELLDTLQRDLS